MWELGPHQSVTDAGDSEDASTVNFQLQISISILKGHLDFIVLHCFKLNLVPSANLGYF